MTEPFDLLSLNELLQGRHLSVVFMHHNRLDRHVDKASSVTTFCLKSDGVT